MDNININDYIMKCIGINKIKYDVLDAIFKDFKMHKYSTLNIHIDLNSILKILYTDTINNNINDSDDFKLTISSSILNMIAHWRAYFCWRHKINTRFFLYYNTKENEYFKLFNNKKYKISNSVNDAIKLIKIICKYCPKIYFIYNTINEPLLSMYYYINKFETNKNIIITKDELYFQLINIKNTNIFRLKRDNSILLNKDNIYDYILRHNKYKVKYMSSKLISLYLSYTGIQTRKINGCMKTKIIKKIDNEIELGHILNDHYSNLDELFNDSNLPYKDNVTANYNSIDLSMLLTKFTSADAIKLDDLIIDKYSNNDLKELNIHYYTGDLSLMLNELVLEVKHTEWR